MRQRGRRPTPVQRELRRIAEAVERHWHTYGDPLPDERGLWGDHVLSDGCCYAAKRLGMVKWAFWCVVARFTPAERDFIAPPGTMWSERILWLYLLAEAGEEVAYR